MIAANNKHLMTGPRETNSLFPEGPVIKCFVIPPDIKNRKNSEKYDCLTLLHPLATLVKLSGSQNQAVLLKKLQ